MSFSSEKERLEFRLASDPESSPELLSELARSKSELIRCAVASNIATKDEDISMLSMDENESVKASLELRRLNLKMAYPAIPSVSRKKH